MLEQLVYKNHRNEVFTFGKNGIYVNTNDLRDYEWKTQSKGDRITDFTRGIGSRTLPVVIICRTEKAANEAKNLLFETVEKDVLARKYGQIILNGYYFRCYVTKSTKANYLQSKRYMTLTLTLKSEHPYWVKETKTSFKPESTVASNSTSGIDYPYDFNHDYLLPKTTTLYNNGFAPANFRAVIYGPCVNPSIVIGGHTYQVNCVVGSGDRLTIDSTEKTIVLVQKNGSTVNAFSSRYRDSYIFEPIAAGNSAVRWDGTFSFDIILLEERSEPRWI